MLVKLNCRRAFEGLSTDGMSAVSSIIHPAGSGTILQERKRGLREVMLLVWGHTAG